MDLSVAGLFETPTVGALAEWIARSLAEGGEVGTVARVVGELESLSDDQARRLLGEAVKQEPSG